MGKASRDGYKDCKVLCCGVRGCSCQQELSAVNCRLLGQFCCVGAGYSGMLWPDLGHEVGSHGAN